METATKRSTGAFADQSRVDSGGAAGAIATSDVDVFSRIAVEHDFGRAVHQSRVRDCPSVSGSVDASNADEIEAVGRICGYAGLLCPIQKIGIDRSG